MRGATEAILATVFTAFVAGACTDTSIPDQSKAAADFQKELLLRLINAEPGDVIAIPAGVHEISRATNHGEAIAVVRDWINSRSGEC